ncbi:MAG: hypothetical protein IPN26_06670 [Bacteroidetes bacterium]|nr:hypothetical protein [Bacteroidota bacterium]
MKTHGRFRFAIRHVGGSRKTPNYIDFEDGARQSDQEWVYRWVEEKPGFTRAVSDTG